MEGIYWYSVVPITMWAKIHIKTSYSKHVEFLLVLGGGPMSCLYVGAKFRSQYLSHMMPNLGGGFVLRTR